MGAIRSVDARPWETLERFIRAGAANEIDAYLRSLEPAETARAVLRLSAADQVSLFALLAPQQAADLLEDVSDAQAADLIDDLPPARAAAIVDEMQSDHQADVLGELEHGEAAAILERMEPAEAADVRRLLRYPPDTAGGIMITEFLAYQDTWRVAEVLEDLRAHAQAYSDYEVQYAYVVSAAGALSGVLRLRDVLFAQREQRVVDVMRTDPLHVPADAALAQLAQLFAEHAFLGVPVTDEHGHLIGVVQRAAVQAAVEEHAGRTFLAFAGISQEEVRTMPLMARVTGRLSWLSINVVLNVLAASVIALYQDTLAQAIVLAVFLPIISDMSGCSGNQAVAVSIRELTVGLVKPHELLHVFRNEVGLGMINGLALGCLLGAAAFLWRENPYLGLVVGGSLALNTVVAVALGGLLPLLLRGLRFDPALASGPILTTVTDMCGFFILLSLATAVLPKLAAP